MQSVDDAPFKYDDPTFTKVARKKRKNRAGNRCAPSPAESVEKTLSELRSDGDWVRKCVGNPIFLCTL